MSSSSSPKNNQILPLNDTFSPMLFIGEGTSSSTKNGQLATQNRQHLLSQSATLIEHQNMQMNYSSTSPNLIVASTPVISSPPSVSSFSLPPAAIISGNSSPPISSNSNSSSPNSSSKCQQPNGIDLLQSFLTLVPQNGQSSAFGLLQQLAQHKLEQQSQNQSNRQIQSNQQHQMQLFAHQMFGGGDTTIPSPTEILLANNQQIGGCGPILTDSLREAIAAAIQQQQQNVGQKQVENGKEDNNINMAKENRVKLEKNVDFALQLNSLPPILGFNLNTMPNSQSYTPPSTTFIQQPTLMNNLPNSGHNSIANHSNRPVRSQRAPMKEIITLDDPNELDEFMANGEEQCIQDMRAFITQFSLRQTTVAMMTGVSQPYISKLLNGNHRELSLRCRKNIYCWYLNCRRHPEKLTMFVHDQPISRLETTVDGELVPQRRERYVFRPVLIRILETYFRESPFPDTAKRAEIANACNSNLQLDKKGNQLMPKEVVTPQVVANWFANKRKEMRRKSQGSGGNGNVGGRMSQRNGNGNIQQFGHHQQINEFGGGGGNSSSAASSSSSLSPSSPNSAKFGQTNIFNGFEQPNLTALLEDIQNQQQMKGIEANGKNVEEILLTGKQNLLLRNLLLQQQKTQQKPMLGVVDCAPLLPRTVPNSSSSSISSLPLQSPFQHNNIPNGFPLLEHFLLLQQQQNALSMLPTTTFGPSNFNLMDPSQLAALQLAAAAAFINQSPSGNSAIGPSIFASSIHAAKLMENTATQLATTQNPQLLATFER